MKQTGINFFLAFFNLSGNIVFWEKLLLTFAVFIRNGVLQSGLI